MKSSGCLVCGGPLPLRATMFCGRTCKDRASHERRLARKYGKPEPTEFAKPNAPRRKRKVAVPVEPGQPLRRGWSDAELRAIAAARVTRIPNGTWPEENRIGLLKNDPRNRPQAKARRASESRAG